MKWIRKAADNSTGTLVGSPAVKMVAVVTTSLLAPHFTVLSAMAITPISRGSWGDHSLVRGDKLLLGWAATLPPPMDSVFLSHPFPKATSFYSTVLAIGALKAFGFINWVCKGTSFLSHWDLMS